MKQTADLKQGRAAGLVEKSLTGLLLLLLLLLLLCCARYERDAGQAVIEMAHEVIEKGMVKSTAVSQSLPLTHSGRCYGRSRARNGGCWLSL
jgi:hypothetical protein